MRNDSLLPLAALLSVTGVLCGCQADRADREARPDAVARADEHDETDVAPGEKLSAAARGAPSGPTPIADGAIFSAQITHPFLPLTAVRHAEFKSQDERVVREVADETEMVGGVECLVLAEQEYDGGELAEISYNYFAQDSAGNVWYFGENVDEYDAGQVVSHGGAWLVGRDATEPCLIMPATPVVGLGFKPENSPPDAEEFDEIDALDAELTVPAGRFSGVLVVKEGDRPGEWKERKYYARGVGLISENQELNLVALR